MKYILLTLMLMISGCSYTLGDAVKDMSVIPSPKFKAGECIALETSEDYEFTESKPIDIKKILKVGKRNYLYTYVQLRGVSVVTNQSAEIKYTLYDEIYFKVDCPK